MNNVEAKEVMEQEIPVIFAGQKFKKIQALVFTQEGLKVRCSAELLDKTGRCIVRAPISRIARVLEDDINKTHEDDNQLIFESIFHLEQKMDLITNNALANKLDDTSQYVNELMRDLISFSNFLEKEIKKRS